MGSYRCHRQRACNRNSGNHRVCKVLEDAGLKMTTVITDVMGVSGRAMLAALVAGTTDAVSPDLARGMLRKKLPALQRALQGRFRAHHAFLLQESWPRSTFSMRRWDVSRRRSIAGLSRNDVFVLDTIPGVNRTSAISIVAETGADMHRFPTAGHLCSWAAMCPGHNESAGKRHSGKTRKGNRYLRATLIQTGLSATRKNGSALQARYHRVKRHRGHKKAVVAVGHQILEIAFYLMRDGVTYQELGADYFDCRHAERATRRHVRQLEALGIPRHDRKRRRPEPHLRLTLAHFLSSR